MRTVEQGEILKTESIPDPLLVVSKNFFNRSEEAFVCPVVKAASPDPLHIALEAGPIEGIVLCEQVRMLDFRVRGFQKAGSISLKEIMNITDAIQSIFDYI
ncbi:MAG: type II toxin-antitoxin system PemK/MazF family toxin [Lachnospiraceae bacterium]|jgi:mRNA-degrading endonuclease toxin of MazEF toxin-antitoxin module|nr:type II toxin-antitoxin system PemK/MazF family toxin [Lachnospiraceae bacterium]MCI1727013.1 type II toxin-antitoxin system PemK/MazF family toxin [Lachnospiraceae bacterium]